MQRYGGPSPGSPAGGPLSGYAPGAHGFDTSLAAPRTEPVLIVTLPDETVRIGMPCGDTGGKGADESGSVPQHKAVAPYARPTNLSGGATLAVVPGAPERGALQAHGPASPAPSPAARTAGEVELADVSVRSSALEGTPAPREPEAISVDRVGRQDCLSGGSTEGQQL